MYVLGLNAFHGDSAAALIRRGYIIAAAEEERFRRVKHWAGFPSHAIAYCLREAGVSLSEVDHIAINQDNRANMARKLGYLIRRRPDPALVLHRLRNRARRQGVLELLANQFPDEPFRGTFHNIEHHVCHLYSAYYVSTFFNAAIVSVDGFGDFASTAWGEGRGGKITVGVRVYFPHSLGMFYQALTQYLGFPHYGDEYKVMGLAPYGEPTYLDAMRRIVRLKPDGRFELNLTYFQPPSRSMFPTNGRPARRKWTISFRPHLRTFWGHGGAPDEPLEERHRDIARSVQAMYEEAFFNMLIPLQQRTGLTDLALAGGCAANSVANGKVRRMTPFQRVYVHSAAGDAGGAIGAAYAVWDKLGGGRHFVMDHAYLGPAIFASRKSPPSSKRQRPQIDAAGCAVEEIADESALCRRAAASGGRRQGYRLVPGPHGMGPSRARQPLHRRRSAPRRHEGDPQCQDQTPRIVPAVRAFGAVAARSANGSKKTTTSPS